jgi:hypothetical protein
MRHAPQETCPDRATFTPIQWASQPRGVAFWWDVTRLLPCRSATSRSQAGSRRRKRPWSPRCLSSALPGTPCAALVRLLALLVLRWMPRRRPVVPDPFVGAPATE